MPVDELLALATEQSLTATAYPSVAEAIAAARSALNNEDALLITGSFFIVGEAMQAWA